MKQPKRAPAAVKVYLALLESFRLSSFAEIINVLEGQVGTLKRDGYGKKHIREVSFCPNFLVWLKPNSKSRNQSVGENLLKQDFPTSHF